MFMENNFAGITQSQMDAAIKRAEKQDRKFKKRIKKLLKKQKQQTV